MKMNKKTWLPIIGIYFAVKEGGWMFLNEDWMKFQVNSITVTFGIILISMLF